MCVIEEKTLANDKYRGISKTILPVHSLNYYYVFFNVVTGIRTSNTVTCL